MAGVRKHRDEARATFVFGFCANLCCRTQKFGDVERKNPEERRQGQKLAGCGDCRRSASRRTRCERLGTSDPRNENRLRTSGWLSRMFDERQEYADVRSGFDYFTLYERWKAIVGVVHRRL